MFQLWAAFFLLLRMQSFPRVRQLPRLESQLAALILMHQPHGQKCLWPLTFFPSRLTSTSSAADRPRALLPLLLSLLLLLLLLPLLLLLLLVGPA